MLKEMMEKYKKQKHCNHNFTRTSVERGIDFSGFEWKRERFECSYCGKKECKKYLILGRFL